MESKRDDKQLQYSDNWICYTLFWNV